MKLPIEDLEEIARRVFAGGGEALRGCSVLVTGGTGFIGRWLVETFCAFNTLANMGGRIAVLSRNAERFRASAPHLTDDPAVTMIEGDLRHLGQVAASSRFDFVIHGATETAANLAKEHPRRLFFETIEGTREALDFAAHAGARRFLYLSSGAMYGRQPSDLSHIPEDFNGAPDLVDPQSAYGETKRVGELLCSSYARSGRLETVIARGFAAIGPHIPLNQKFAAGSFLGDALSAKRIEVQGDGSPVRSYMYAGDLAVWLWVLLLRGVNGRAYNVGSETAVSLGELATEVARLADPPLPVTILGRADPANRPQRFVPSTRRAQEELQLTETTDWRTALRKTYEWYRRVRLAELTAGSIR